MGKAPDAFGARIIPKAPQTEGHMAGAPTNVLNVPRPPTFATAAEERVDVFLTGDADLQRFSDVRVEVLKPG